MKTVKISDQIVVLLFKTKYWTNDWSKFALCAQRKNSVAVLLNQRRLINNRGFLCRNSLHLSDSVPGDVISPVLTLHVAFVLQAAIRKELNEFKSNEMEVHSSSKHLTRSVWMCCFTSAAFMLLFCLEIMYVTRAVWHCDKVSKVHYPLSPQWELN